MQYFINTYFPALAGLVVCVVAIQLHSVEFAVLYLCSMCFFHEVRANIMTDRIKDLENNYISPLEEDDF